MVTDNPSDANYTYHLRLLLDQKQAIRNIEAHRNNPNREDYNDAGVNETLRRMENALKVTKLYIVPPGKTDENCDGSPMGTPITSSGEFSNPNTLIICPLASELSNNAISEVMEHESSHLVEATIPGHRYDRVLSEGLALAYQWDIARFGNQLGCNYIHTAYTNNKDIAAYLSKINSKEPPLCPEEMSSLSSAGTTTK